MAKPELADCSKPDCCGGASRREFLSLVGLAGAAALMGRMPAYAGPFTAEDFARLIPPDKKLKPEWVKSLFERGEPTVYAKSRDELKFIGMPVGGIGCGTLYLSGDGRLWNWDIFNENQNGVLPRDVPWSEVGLSFAGQGSINPQNGANYVKPHASDEPQARRVAQGFALQLAENGKLVTRQLDVANWAEVEFVGQYPIGTVTFRDPACPVEAQLEAYSPFIPLNADDSSLPATVLTWTLKNVSSSALEATISGWLENACSLLRARPGSGNRVNTAVRGKSATMIVSSFDRKPPTADPQARADIVIADFEKGDYQQLGWHATGEAFGAAPIERAKIPAYQGDVGGAGQRVVNSHASAPGADIAAKDAKTGTLTSPKFRIERKFLTFWIGGGANAEHVGIRLIVDNRQQRRTTGQNANAMRQEVFDVAEFAGLDAVLEIYDQGTGGWGNIGIDHIAQTDVPRVDTPLEKEGDWGTMAFAVLGEHVDAVAQLEDDRAKGGKVIGELSQKLSLGPGESKAVSFIVAWHFPNKRLGIGDDQAYYAKRFATAAEVADYVVENFDRLSSTTRLWRDTWYDSTLPYWFLDRAMANTSTLATTTCHRVASGRFWAWEGVGCCPGTCTHVWHYAQAVGRIFPEIERDHRERVDFGVGFNEPSGVIGHRGESTGPAVDGQAGRILGAYREHQMSADSEFLKRLWPKVRRATEYLLKHDPNADGILDGAQENTLDAAWFGEIAWLSGLALAAFQAAAAMADEMGDAEFAKLCRERIAAGKRSIESRLWNGEYFVQRPEQGKEGALGTYQCCHIDQVFGEAWLHQVSLPAILDREKIRSALASLYKYNFAPDVGPFRKHNTEGRPYALAGDGGLIIATNPKALDNPFGGPGWQVGYFNECMSGFEHQAIWHMLSEGMTLEALACFRAIHDRYHASLRNPYNEVECSDHYARAMASYGVFIAACGFDYHGPRGHIGFAPRLQPENFRAPFVTAEGWGTFSQTRAAAEQKTSLVVKHGKLRLQSLAFEMADGKQLTDIAVTLDGTAMDAKFSSTNQRAEITLAREVILQPNQKLEVNLNTR